MPRKVKYIGKTPVYDYCRQIEINNPKCLGHHNQGIFEYHWCSDIFDLGREFYMDKKTQDRYHDSGYVLYIVMSFNVDHHPLKIHQVGTTESSRIQPTFDRLQKSGYQTQELIVLRQYSLLSNL